MTESTSTPSGKTRSGKARMEKLTPEQRRELGRAGAMERWRRARARQVAIVTSIHVPGENGQSESELDVALLSVPNDLPIAKWPGQLGVGIACYVLSDGRRIISRTGATSFLTDGKGGGNLESFLGVQALRKYVPENLPGMMIDFVLPEVVNKSVKGMEAETFVDICQAYVDGWMAGDLKTESQIAIATRANMFLRACTKVGIIALIDEATGFQYERPLDALQFKLKLFLAEEMRKWEKTFPDELWEHFGRLTRWKGGVAL